MISLPEYGNWVGHMRAVFYEGNVTPEDIAEGRVKIARRPDGSGEWIVEAENILANLGIQLLEDLLIGAGGTVFNNANSYIGVGDSTTAAAATQTDLQAVTNKFKKAMDVTFPSRTSQTLTWRVTYSTSEANFSIQEIAVFNGGPAFATGTMLNRIVSDLGTKTAAVSLQVTVTVTIS